MTLHDATEAVYRNGYEQGKRDAEKHGRWVRVFNCKPMCSECGEYHLYAWSDHAKCNYCPNCRAKMNLPEPYNPNIPRDQWEDRARFD